MSRLGRTLRDLLDKEEYWKQLRLELRRRARKQKQEMLRANQDRLKLENAGQSRLFMG